jgi:hypothetical protein
MDQYGGTGRQREATWEMSVGTDHERNQGATIIMGTKSIKLWVTVGVLSAAWLLFVAPSARAAATQPASQPSSQPVASFAREAAPEPDLTFLLTFDKMSTVADYAGGNPVSTTFAGDLELRNIPGYNQKNAFNLKEGESLKYDVVNNIDPRQGTLIIWLMANNYDPSSVNPSDTDKSHKSVVHVLFNNGNAWVRFFLYEYYDTPVFYFYWSNSWCKSNEYKLAGAPAIGIGKKQWFQLALTWDLESIKIFLNGELRTQTRLPEEARMAKDFKPSPDKSFLGIRDRFWPGGSPDIGKETVVDDIRVHSRPLSALEIKRQYQRAAPNRGGPKDALPNIDVLLNGVDDAVGALDRLRVDLDYHPLAEPWRKAIQNGQVKAKAVLKAPGGKELVEEWSPKSLLEARTLTGVDKEGEYVFALTLTGPDGKAEKAEKKVTRPNTDWFDNGLGLEDEVPPPWTPLTVSDKNVVSVWGRTCEFGNYPLPRQIIHTGDALLAEPPELQVVTSAGLAKLQHEITKREIHKSYVVFTGTSTAQGFSLSWTTRVEFDGFIRWDFTVHGEPTVESMKLAWTVKREFADYLLDPLLKQSGNGEFKSPFPRDERNGATVLWLTSDKKGFCWTPEDNANWVYDRAYGSPIHAEITDQGGHCAVEMISKTAKVPEGASYHAMFMATPSRPLPKVFRTYRFGGFGGFSNCDVSLEHQAGEGTEGVFTLKPSKTFGGWMEHLRARNVKRAAIYGGATGLNDACPEGKYFGRYWDIPSGPSYPFVDPFGGTKCMQTNTCPHTRYSDYILWNIRLLFEHPQQMHTAIYYDLSDNVSCANPLHGCSFKDKFGNTINRLIVMGLRRHMMRTLKYCHQMGRETIFHAHSFYNPVCHDFADYWFPGEQYTTLMQEKRSPYVYSDDIPDDVFRTELNMRLKGSGILFLGNLRRANSGYGSEEQTLAMCTKLLLNDVPISIAFEEGNVINRIWGIGLKYQLDSADIVFYYAKDNRVKSSNPKVAATYYRCKDGRILAMVGNLSKEEQTAEIDCSALKNKLLKVCDEYAGTNLDAPDGKVTLVLKGRQFRIIGF